MNLYMGGKFYDLRVKFKLGVMCEVIMVDEGLFEIDFDEFLLII